MNLDGSINVTLVDGCDLPPPFRATEGAAGFDLRSRVSIDLAPGERAMVPTGFRWEIPSGSVGLICPRSGLAIKYGVTVINAPGVVDSDYRGEVCVLLVNLDFHGLNSPAFRDRLFRINIGDRIAQMVIVPTKALATLANMTSALQETVRGTDGFGSTGVA